ncbi:hypothetical protein [Tenacibaculum sp. 190524A05c]|uniref:hypothetical protein n=1 Tax=Tenacibaculum platacis TaxID=3137852 RepID=UPI0031FB7A11
MNKLSLKSSWLLFLIPIGMIIFVVLPQLQDTYEQFQKKDIEHQQKVQQLDSLKELPNPTTKIKSRIAKLEIEVKVHGAAIEKQRYTNYKIGGMLVVLVFMFLGMFGSSYWMKRKKSSSKNRQIQFTFEDPSVDAIGQHISWDAVSGSGSNFLSEHLKKTNTGYKITSSNYMKFLSWSFFLIGVNQLVWTFVEHFNLTKESIGIMEIGKTFFTSGGVFIIVGAFLFLLTSAKAHIYIRKRKIIVDGLMLDFKDAYALQVLQKFVQGNKTGGYYCYEVNLITKEGHRYNLLNHGDKTYLLSDMVKISKVLKVPVWNNGVV